MKRNVKYFCKRLSTHTDIDILRLSICKLTSASEEKLKEIELSHPIMEARSAAHLVLNRIISNQFAWFAHNRNILAMREMIENGIVDNRHINARDQYGRTLLHILSDEHGIKEIIDVAGFLLDNGADVNAQMNTGETPLHTHSMIGTPEYADLLLRYGANIYIRAGNGETARDRAIRAGRNDILAIYNKWQGK